MSNPDLRMNSPSGGLPSVRVRWAGPAWLLLAVLAAVAFFWGGLEALAYQWWTRPEYRFKAAVPLLALLLFLQVLRTGPAAPLQDRSRWLGVIGICLALGLAASGTIVRIDDLVFVAIYGWVVSLVVVCFGLRGALLFWAPLATLSLMLPLPYFMVAVLQRILEGIAANIGLELLGLLDIPAVLEGQLIDFGHYQVRTGWVAGVLVNFLPVLLVVFSFATVYRGPLWSRLIPVLFAGPVMVGLAAVRIALLGLTVDQGGVAAGERFLRATSDWVFFGASVAVLLALVLVAQRLAGHALLRGQIDFDARSLAAQFRRAGSTQPTVPLVVAAIATATAVVLFAVSPSRPAATIEREDFQMFPPEFGEWTGTRSAIANRTELILNADDYVLIDFMHPEAAAPVNFWAAYYLRQDSDKGGIHSPQDCIPAGGWNFLSLRPTEVTLDGNGGTSLRLNRAVIRKDGQSALLYYWFEGRGRSVANERAARLLVKWDGLIRGRTDGALVRYSTPILTGETESDADARLQEVLAASLGQLPRFVPP